MTKLSKGSIRQVILPNLDIFFFFNHSKLADPPRFARETKVNKLLISNNFEWTILDTIATTTQPFPEPVWTCTYQKRWSWLPAWDA